MLYSADLPDCNLQLQLVAELSYSELVLEAAPGLRCRTACMGHQVLGLQFYSHLKLQIIEVEDWCEELTDINNAGHYIYCNRNNTIYSQLSPQLYSYNLCRHSGHRVVN